MLQTDTGGRDHLRLYSVNNPDVTDKQVYPDIVTTCFCQIPAFSGGNEISSEYSFAVDVSIDIELSADN